MKRAWPGGVRARPALSYLGPRQTIKQRAICGRQSPIPANLKSARNSLRPNRGWLHSRSLLFFFLFFFFSFYFATPFGGMPLRESEGRFAWEMARYQGTVTFAANDGGNLCDSSSERIDSRIDLSRRLSRSLIEKQLRTSRYGLDGYFIHFYNIYRACV